ncbi:hypothetical protein [Rugosimonospora africana]|uniref:Uncharacterized protein n=1 Tax=Rugosimonospora africana TaxID=556532 RepID=A0A8J3VSD7_9ACTN|nr:hypothetical protein [Rugosimonospora africana]GIH17140.1 hypothetical protein Raf01_53120 [Rugosimonospora africana]
MNSADERDIRNVMSEVTRDLEPSPVLMELVRRKVRRRNRQHGLLAAAAAVVLLVAVGGVLALRPWHADNRYDAPLAPIPGFDQPTRGDLAGDNRYADDVTTAWGAWARQWQVAKGNSYRVTELGATNLTWALNTPAGRVAVIEQELTVSEDHVDHPGVAIGYLTDIVGRPHVVDALWEPLDQPLEQLPFPGGTGGMLAGADRSVLVVFDPGGPVGYSVKRTYHPDGQITRDDWKPLHFTGGVAVVRVPPRADQGAIAVAPRPYGQSQPLWLVNTADNAGIYQVGTVPSRDQNRPDGRLNWDTYHLNGPNPGTNECLRLPSPVSYPTRSPFTDPLGASEISEGPFTACGTTPDGSGVTIGDAVLPGDPAFLWYALRSPAGTIRYGYVGPFDASAPLPVKVTLPSGQGYVVARKGAVLSYRINNGPWQGARENAALVPAEATAVQVATNGSSTVVPLG